MPPKRALLSLNVDTTAEHFRERIEDRSKQGKPRITLRERDDRTEPLVANTSVRILTRPFEKEVQRSVERIVDGRVVRDIKTRREDSRTRDLDLDLELKSKRGSIAERYDISDL